MRRFALLLVPVLLLAGEPITSTDMLKIRQITQVELTGDGRTAVYSVRSIHTTPARDATADPEYAYRTHLWAVDLTAAAPAPRQLTFGDRSDAAFALSPDGTRVAFVRTDRAEAKPKPQVWLLPLSGPGEAEKVTTLEYGAAAPVWRPDGKALLVTSPIPLSKIPGKPHFDLERPARAWSDFDRPDPAKKDAVIDARPDGDRRAIRNWLERNAARENPTATTRLIFQGEQGLLPEMTISHLFVIDLADGNKATEITKDFFPYSNASYSPDGTQIVATSTPKSSTHPDRIPFIDRSAIRILNADGSNAREIRREPGQSYLRARFLPGGKSLLVWTRQTDRANYRNTQLARVAMDGRIQSWVTRGWDSQALEAEVLNDGSVYFSTAWQGGAPLMHASAKGDAFTPLTPADQGVGAFAAAAGRTVAALISVPNPNELYLIEKGREPKRLTDLNHSWVSKKTLSLPEMRWLTRPDGTKVQYWVMLPAGGMAAGRKYPWVLDMHGGPQAMWGPGEFSMWWEFQLFCSWGYGVTYANPRGSSGYGYEFARANFQNWGEGPSSDVLAALDDSVAKNAQIDTNRLFLTGGSYAGYLTAWIVGHDHRFKAAAAQRGVYDLATFYGEGNAFGLVESNFGGYPFEAATARILDRESPISYVTQIKTPLLILHASQDLRTGVTQSEMLYRSLKQAGKPVEYIRYPGSGHELTRSGPPAQRLDHMLRIVEFFERFSANSQPAPMAVQ